MKSIPHQEPKLDGNLDPPVTQGALDRYQRIDASIRAEVAKLPGLIEALQTASQQLANTELALGVDAAKEAAELKKDRAAIGDISQQIDAAGERLKRWRGSLSILSPELVKAHAAALVELSKHNANLVAAFVPAWADLIAEWERIRGQRAALEALIGAPIKLPEPRLVTVELPAAMHGPKRLIAEIEGAVKRIADDSKTARHSTISLPNDPAPPAIGSRDVYVMQRASQNVPVGTLVVPATFSEGRLEALVRAGWAVPATAVAIKKGRQEAERAHREIERQKRAAEEAARLADQTRLRAELDEEYRRRDPVGWRAAHEAARADREPEPTMEIIPATMFPDNPERQGEQVRAAHMKPRSDWMRGFFEPPSDLEGL